MNPREEEFPSKKEAIDPNNNKSKFPKVTSSRQWSNYKNPRIVRVSRAFGGKDRHSKVCTVRGLRDRRIRLSVPTAIQLYDLQERLGLNQPSKVVDWLLDATKHEIDKLPPLPMLPQFHQESSNANPQSHLGLYNPTKEGIEENHQEGFGGFVAQNLFPLSNNIQSSFPNFHYWDNNHPNMSLSQFGGGFSFPSNYLTGEDHHQSQNNLSPALPSTSSQLNLFPSATNIIPPIIPCSFPSYLMQDNDLRQINHLQHVQQNSVMPTTLHLISSPMKSLNLKTVYSQENDTGKPDKEKRSS